MPDKWAQYRTPTKVNQPIQDKWAQYAQPSSTSAKQAVPQGVLDNLRAKSAQPTQFELDRAPAVEESQTVRNPWSEAGNFIWGAGKNAVGEVGNIVKSLPSAATAMTDPIGTALHQTADLAISDQLRKASGRSAPYRVAAALGSTVGANVKGMEHAADIGDAQKVAGIAIGDAAPALAPEAYREAAPVIGDSLKNTSYGIYNNVLGTKGRNMAFGANPGRGVAAEGIWGGKSSIANGVQDAIAKRGAQQEQVLGLPQNAAKRIDVTNPVNEPFNNAISNGLDGATPDATIRRLQQTQREITSVRSIGPDGQIVYSGPRDLSNLSPLEANGVKGSLYERTNYRNPDLDEMVNTTLRQAGARVKNAVQTAVPEVQPFNQRLSDLYGAQNSLSKIVNNRMVSPTRSGFTEVAPAVIGTAAGGPFGGAAMTLGREIGRLPKVRTGIAQGLYKFGNALSPEIPLSVPSPRFSALTPPTRALPSGPVITPPPQDPSGFSYAANPPAYNPTTRAQRLGLLLPERTAIPMGTTDPSGPVMHSARPPVNPATRADRLGLLLPEKAGGAIPGTPTPVHSELWKKLQDAKRRP